MNNLHALARLYGVQTAYYDIGGNRITTSNEALLAVLDALGMPVRNDSEIDDAIREHEFRTWRQPLEPVIVCWEGTPFTVNVRLPVELEDTRVEGILKLEDGEAISLEWDLRRIRPLDAEEYRRSGYAVKALPVHGLLPPGYHNLAIDIPGRPASAIVISAPPRAYSPFDALDIRSWGVFIPLYALHSQSGWGSGSFADLERLIEWLSNMGGAVAATLPLMAAFLDQPFDPSPYVPVSRLMWNEFFLDVERIPGFSECASATGLVASHAFQQQIAAHRSSGTVDYRRLMALKRNALEHMVRQAGPELRQYLDANAQVRDYAEFRAATEKQGVAWQQWPERMRNGALEQGDYDEDKFLYHAYAQWQTRQQMESLSSAADRAGLGLYLDLPLGVHPDGYDVWRNQHLFARGVSVGAPPDDFFTRGQDWGFPPLHPDASRMQGHSHIIEVIRNSMRHAGILRLDHVMGLHRLFWIPPGYDARAGAYVRYPDEELYAIVCLESHRQQCWVIGENLGIVPTYVNDAMRKHGLGQMYVSRFQTTGDSQQAFHPVPANSVASFNTHDLPTFAAWWEGMDIQSRLDMGLIDEAETDRQRADLSATRQTLIEYLSGQGFLTGEATAQSVHAACMCYLAGTPARLELLSLEDLWQETRPQNVPGTGYDHGNWQRKAAYTLEEIIGKPEIIDTLRAIDRRRKN